MLKIRQLQKQKQKEANENSSNPSSSTTTRSASSSTNSEILDPAKIRAQKDLSELNLPNTIKLTFPDADDLMNFDILIKPNEGFYCTGKFKFKCEIGSNFPIQPPKLKCLQKIYHPNIDLDGNICLNILREDWSPVLTLHLILAGLQFLFLDPNPNDPLNKDAANDLNKDKNSFKRNVFNSMRGGRVGNEVFDYVL